MLSLRLILALSLGALGLVATWTLAALVTREATARLEAEVGAQLGELAAQMAARLDEGMFERWRDLQVAASLDTLRAPDAPAAPKRAVLGRLQQSYPAYSILLLADPDGRVLATSSGLLEGAEVARRDYFLAGRERPFVGDVHDAILLAKLLSPSDGEPLRLVDLATPVRSADGRLVGVLAAHLDWAWAREMARTLTDSLRGARRGAEILVLARDGAVLLGPPGFQGRRLSSQALEVGRAAESAGTARIGVWPGETDSQVWAVEATHGFRDYPGLGWRVAVRHRADRALAPVEALRRHILFAGTGVSLGAALLAWFIAGFLARPLQDLAQAAAALGRDGRLPALPQPVMREGQTLARALGDAAAELAEREEARRLLVDELNHRVKNTLATVQSMAAQSLRGLGEDAARGRDAFEARLLALSRAHNVLTRENWVSAELGLLAAEAIRPFSGEETTRIALDGPALRLPPQTALSLTMILHELCTNAVKYGALANATGWVLIAWDVREEAGTRRLDLVWREQGGPSVRAPASKGFGSRLIERGIAGRGAGSVALAYAPAGLVCTLSAPLEGVAGRRELDAASESRVAA